MKYFLFEMRSMNIVTLMKLMNIVPNVTTTLSLKPKQKRQRAWKKERELWSLDSTRTRKSPKTWKQRSWRRSLLRTMNWILNNGGHFVHEQNNKQKYNTTNLLTINGFADSMEGFTKIVLSLPIVQKRNLGGNNLRTMKNRITEPIPCCLNRQKES